MLPGAKLSFLQWRKKKIPPVHVLEGEQHFNIFSVLFGGVWARVGAVEFVELSPSLLIPISLVYSEPSVGRAGGKGRWAEASTGAKGARNPWFGEVSVVSWPHEEPSRNSFPRHRAQINPELQTPYFPWLGEQGELTWQSYIIHDTGRETESKQN